MQINKFYRNQSQEAAVSERSQMQISANKHAAYKLWPGLTAYASQIHRDQETEDNVRNKMNEIRNGYRRLSEELEWKYPAARPFCEKKQFIEQSKLFKVFQAMPKCSLLHIHNAAALSPDGFINLLKLWVMQRNIPEIWIVRAPFKNKIPGQLIYQPHIDDRDKCMEVSELLEMEGGEAALRNLISFSDLDRTEGIPYIWDEFNRIFKRTGDLMEDRDFFYLYHFYAFKEMIEDGIEYVELRCSFTEFKEHTEEEKNKNKNNQQNEEEDNPFFAPWNLFGEDIPFLDVLVIAANDAINRYNTNAKKERKFHFRVILTARRDQDILSQDEGDKILLKMDSAIVIKQNPKYANLVCGFDLVSEEDRGKTTYTLYSRGLYEPFGKSYMNYGYSGRAENMLNQHPDLNRLRIQMIDFYLHDGESLWSQNDNMIDALVISRRRIGHGFNLCKFPGLLEDFYGNAVVNGEKCEGMGMGFFLEACPISNQMLRYYPDLRAHSVYELMESGVQCVLGNDDPMILDNPGLSYDFWEAYVGMGLDFYAIKGLLFNAYVCEWLADNGYPTMGNEYVMDIHSMVDTFNRQYWMPFLIEAENIL